MQTFTGREYLLIDIANCFGLDRTLWDERIQWAEDNHPALEYLDVDAKHPILYRKAVRALRVVDRNEPTNHIMGLDATASGPQMMACLSGCHKTAYEVNLLDSGERKDLYESVAHYMDMDFDRDKLKIPIMTTFYGSTAQPKAIFGDGSPELQMYYEVLNKRLTGAMRVLNVIQQFWDSLSPYHEWTLPDGHTAFVPVVDTFEKSLEIDELNHLRMSYRTQTLATKQHSRALAANVIHSVDGYVCRQMVLMAHKQGFWMAPIHDCFYASPNYMNQVRKNYLTILSNICKEPILENMLRNISNKPVSINKASNNLHIEILKANYALS
jgi:DNA-directed RNA polymerase